MGERIDLLKIDVEGSELDVLRGIDDEHWGMVQQVVLEVETFALVRTITEILESRGFEVHSQPTERMENKAVTSEVSHVFASRRRKAADAKITLPPLRKS